MRGTSTLWEGTQEKDAYERRDTWGRGKGNVNYERSVAQSDE